MQQRFTLDACCAEPATAQQQNVLNTCAPKRNSEHVQSGARYTRATTAHPSRLRIPGSVCATTNCSERLRKPGTETAQMLLATKSLDQVFAWRSSDMRSKVLWPKPNVALRSSCHDKRTKIYHSSTPCTKNSINFHVEGQRNLANRREDVGNRQATRVQRPWVSAHAGQQDHAQNRRCLDAAFKPVGGKIAIPTKGLARLKDFAETKSKPIIR